MIETYEGALKYLDGLTVFGIKPGLERIEKILSALGEPQKNYATVHVTGTNGKGSVSAMLAEILKADERIKVDGENISEEEFAAQIERVKNCGVRASHFEVLTAAAYEYFSRRKVDVAVIEVGIGGLWDSTNVITPLVSVITNVALEHEQTLGRGLKNIALNKAGIIKENVPCVTAAAGRGKKIRGCTKWRRRST